MEDRTVNEETLRIIRHITADGIVDKDEVWGLGRFLKDYTARTTWPGNVLWEILEGIFADNVVDDAETEDLTRRLQVIEKECHDRNTPASGLRIPPDDRYQVREISLPEVDLTLEVEAQRPGEPVSQVDLRQHTCTCGDWKKRHQEFDPGSVGRLCRCMATAYQRAMNGQPDLCERLEPDLVNLLRLLSTYGLGGVAESNWRRLESDEFSLFVSWDDQEDWVAIFAESEEGHFERFGYHRSEKRWAFGVVPTGAGAVLSFLDELSQ